VERIPGWAVASSVTAPVVLVGGWTLAARLQPSGYNSIRDTISALAGHGATDRWVMTAALAGLGVCHVVTAAGLEPAKVEGRMLFAAGGVATVLVAAFPQPVSGDARAHTIVATAAFVALGSWPILAAKRGSASRWLAAPVGAAATVGLLGLVTWFAVELHGDFRGLAERAAAGAEAVWPLCVVVATRRTLARRARPDARRQSTPRTGSPE
jgi:hypothetical membrane protein